MKILRALLPWLLVTLAVPGSAAALDIGPRYRVYLHENGAMTQVGTWTLDLDSNLEEACRYSVKWSPSPGPADLYLDEQKTAGRLSCATDNHAHFATTLSLAPGLPAIWRHGDRTDQIMSMTLIEDESGAMKGTVRLRDGGTHVVTVTP